MKNQFNPTLIANEIAYLYKVSHPDMPEAFHTVMEQHIRYCVEELMAERLSFPIDLKGIYEERHLVAAQYVENDYTFLHQIWKAISNDKAWHDVINAVVAMEKGQYQHQAKVFKAIVDTYSEVEKSEHEKAIFARYQQALDMKPDTKELFATGKLTLGRLLQMQPDIIFNMN